MSLPTAVKLATTIFSYFSPTKSPFYSVIVFGTTSLILTKEIEDNWVIIFSPIAILLIYATILSLKDKPDFQPQEYNDQIKFSRTFGISAAVLCFVYTGREIPPIETETNTETINHWYFWLAYFSSLSQMAIFMFYTHVYANLKAKPNNKNFIQLALITSNYLIGATYITVQYNESQPVEILSIMAVLYFLWFVMIVVWLNHLRKTINFKILVPDDAESIA